MLACHYGFQLSFHLLKRKLCSYLCYRNDIPVMHLAYWRKLAPQIAIDLIDKWFALHYSTLVVVSSMQRRECHVASHGTAVHSDACTHRFPFLYWNFLSGIWYGNTSLGKLMGILVCKLLKSEGIWRCCLQNIIWKPMGPQVTPLFVSWHWWIF